MTSTTQDSQVHKNIKESSGHPLLRSEDDEQPTGSPPSEPRVPVSEGVSVAPPSERFAAKDLSDRQLDLLNRITQDPNCIHVTTGQYIPSENAWVFGIEIQIDSENEFEELTMRRYSHFCAFRMNLEHQFEGTILPVLPSKDYRMNARVIKSKTLSVLPTVEHYEDLSQSAVLEERRRMLERFIRTLSQNDEVRKSQLFADFLFQSIQEYARNLAVPKSGLISQLKKKWNLKVKAKKAKLRTGEFDIEVVEEQVRNDHKQFKEIARRISQLQTSQRKMGESFMELAKVFSDSDELQLGRASQTSSSILKSLLDKEQLEVITIVNWYLHMSGEVERKIRWLKYIHNLEAELQKKLDHLNKDIDKINKKQSQHKKLNRKLDTKEGTLSLLKNAQDRQDEALRRFNQSYMLYSQQKATEVPRIFSRFFEMLKSQNEKQAKVFGSVRLTESQEKSEI